MIWISQFIFALFITIITGTIGLGFWTLGKNVFLKWDPNLVYINLRLVSLMHLLPVCYIAINLTAGGYIQTEHIWQLNFSVAGLMIVAFFITGIIWSSLALSNIKKYRKQNGSWYRTYRENIPVEEERVQREFQRICRKLHIRRKVKLYWNDSILSPMFSGLICPKVVLPCRYYSREQLTVIFYHELTHYKNCDVLYKFCCLCAKVVEHFDIFSGRLTAHVREWSEYHCDVKATEAMSDEMTPKQYFEIIIDIMSEMPGTDEEKDTFSLLYESRHSLERRIDYMKRYRNAAKRAKGFTFLAAFMFTMLSMTTAYAAGRGLAVINDEIFKMTETVEVVSDLKEGQKVISIPAEKDTGYKLVYENTQAEYSVMGIKPNEAVGFNWTVTPGTRCVASQIYLKAGQTIEASCTSMPANQTYWLGVMDPHNNSKCVEGTGAMSHAFVVAENGYYRVMVQNRGTVNINAVGSFGYY